MPDTTRQPGFPTDPIIQKSINPASAPARILLLGLGNDLLTDDAIGLNVARAVRQRLLNSQLLDVQETSEMGLSLLDLISGYDGLVVVDAVQTRQVPPGATRELDLASLQVLPATAPHFVGLGEVIALGRKLEMPMPSQVKIFAIEAAEVFALGTRMTQPLEEALPGIVERVLAALQAMSRGSGTANLD